MLTAEKGRHLGRHRARHDPVGDLHHGHGDTLRAGHGRELQANEAATDHHGALGVSDAGFQRLSVLQGAQIKHALQFGAGGGQGPLTRAGGQHQMVVVHRATVGQAHPTLGPFDSFRADAFDELDPILAVERGRAQQQALLIRLAQQKGLGQGRALIGPARLLAHQGQGAVIALVAQGNGGLNARLAGPDDDDLVHPDILASWRP